MKRVLSLILALALLMCMVPAQVYAQTGEQEETTITENATVQGTNAVGSLLSEDIQQEQSEQESITGYNVTELTVEGNLAYVEYSALEDATVVVGIYDEEGVTLLASGKGEAVAGNGEVYIDIEGQMPQYFRAIAYVLDAKDHRPLCSAYETPLYTYQMQTLLNSTAEDYDEELVLKLDEDNTTNFAVYNENTVRVEEKPGVNTLVSADPDSYTYIFENPDSELCSLIYGDVLVYAYGENELVFVKVSSVSVEDSRAYIQGMDLQMEDVFSHVKIEANGDTSQVEVDTATADSAVTYNGMTQVSGPATRSWEGDSSAKVEMNYSIVDLSDKDDSSEFSLSIGLGLQIKTGLKYYIALRGSYIKFTTEIEAGVSVEATGKLEKPFPLGKVVVPVFAGLNIGFEPEFKISFEGKIEWSTKYKQTVGFAYEGGSFQNLTENPEVVYSCEAEITIFVGLDLKPNFSVISSDIAKIEASIPIGVELKATTTGIANDLFHTYDETYHGCVLCLDGEIYFKAGFSVKIELLNMDWLSCSVNIIEVKIPLVDFYYSFDKLSGGEGDCPYKKYPVTVETVDSNGDPIPGVAVMPADTDWVRGTDSQGLTSYFLEPGSYHFIAAKGDMSGSTQVEIKEPQKVTITLLLSGAAGQNVNWTLDKEGNLTVSGNGEIPDYASFTAAPWSEYAEQIKNIHITDGITSVGNYAFTGCSNAESVYMGAGVSKLNAEDWAGCANLTSFQVSANNGSYYADSYGVLYNKNKTVLIKALCQLSTNYELPDSLITIGARALSGQTALAELILPENISAIEAQAFAGCTGLKLLTFTGPAPTIAADALTGVETEALYCIEKDGWTADKLQNYGGTITWTGYESVLGSGTCGTNLVWKLFDNGNLVISGTGAMYNFASYGPWYDQRSSITKIDVMPGVTTVGEDAFYGLSNVTEISLPQGLTSIGYGAFRDCAALKSVQIPDTVTTLGAYAFCDCKNLEQVTISNGITAIPQYAFGRCSKIADVQIPESVIQIGDHAFYDNNSLTTIIIPQNVTTIGDEAFHSCDGVTTIRIDATSVQIGERSFYDCNGLISIDFADGTDAAATVIGADAFSQCDNLREVRFGSSVKEIGESAFAACPSLTKLIWGSGIQTVATEAFGVAYSVGLAPVEQIHITDLSAWLSVSFGSSTANPMASGAKLLLNGSLVESLQIPETITEIKPYAFCEYDYLKSITIPSWISKIGISAFANCSALKTIYFEGVAPTVNAAPFYGVTATVYHPDHESWTESVRNAFGGSLTWIVSGSAASTAAYDTDTQTLQANKAQSERHLSGTAAKNAEAIPASEERKTVTFSGLDAEEAYILIVLQSTQEEDLLTFDNLIYIWQTTAAEDGTASFSYCAREGVETVYELICGGKKRDLSDATVAVPQLTEKVGLQRFLPVVSMNGIQLLEGRDYELTGDVTFQGVGSYTCFIRGIGKYTGMYACSYDVAANNGSAGLEYAISADGSYCIVAGIGSCTDEDIVIPAENNGLPVNAIGEKAFYGCADIRTVRFTDKVIHIASGAFGNCTNLAAVAIGFKLQQIDVSAFAGCSALQNVYYMGSASDWQSIAIGSDNDPLLAADIAYEYCLHKYVNGICVRCADITAKAGETVTLTVDMDVQNVCVPAKVTLDLNGHTLTANAFASFGDLFDTVGTGIVKANNYAFAENQSLVYEVGYLPVYDSTASGYRFFLCDSKNLGMKKEEDRVTFGYALNFEDPFAYEVLAATQDPRLDVLFNVYVDDVSIGTYAFDTQLIRQYALLQQKYPTAQAALLLKVNGIKNLEDETDLLVSAQLKAGERTKSIQMGWSDYFYALPVPDNSYTVRYAANGGTGKMLRSFHPAGVLSKLQSNAFVKEGYSFGGWKKDNGDAIYADCAAVLDLTPVYTETWLYAQWVPNTYTILYNATITGNVSSAFSQWPSATSCTYDTAVTLAQKPELKGWTFCGWYLDKACTEKLGDAGAVIEAANLTAEDKGYVSLYGKWIPNSYTVVYDGYGATGGTMENSCFVYDESDHLRTNAYTRTGYRMVGWSAVPGGAVVCAPGATVNNLTTVADAVVTLYAVWVPNTYTVRYDGNGAAGIMADTQHTYDVSANISENAYTKTGYSHMGWATSANGKVEIEDGANVKNLTDVHGATVTLYARWYANVYYVEYYGNGGEGVMERSVLWYDEDACLRPNTFTRAGHTFAGWATSADGPVVYDDIAQIRNLATEDSAVVKLYAKWTPNTYTIVYHGNGATGGSTASTTHTYGVSGNLRTNGFTRPNYTFLGWSTNSAAVKPTYSNGQAVNLTNSGTVNLYAVWVMTNVTVGYYSRDIDIKSAGYGEYYYTGLDKTKLKSNGYTTLNISMRVDGQRWNWVTQNNEPYVEIYNSAGGKAKTLSLSKYPKDWQSQYLTFTVSVDTLNNDGSIWIRFGTNNQNWQLGDVELSITVT